MLVLGHPSPERHRGRHTDDAGHRAEPSRRLKGGRRLLRLRPEDAVRGGVDPDRTQPLLERANVRTVVARPQHPAKRRGRVTKPPVLPDPCGQCRRRQHPCDARDRIESRGRLEPSHRARCLRAERPVRGRPDPHRGQPALQHLNIATVRSGPEDTGERRTARRRLRGQRAEQQHDERDDGAEGGCAKSEARMRKTNGIGG